MKADAGQHQHRSSSTSHTQESFIGTATMQPLDNLKGYGKIISPSAAWLSLAVGVACKIVEIIDTTKRNKKALVGIGTDISIIVAAVVEKDKERDPNNTTEAFSLESAKELLDCLKKIKRGVKKYVKRPLYKQGFYYNADKNIIADCNVLLQHARNLFGLQSDIELSKTPKKSDILKTTPIHDVDEPSPPTLSTNVSKPRIPSTNALSSTDILPVPSADSVPPPVSTGVNVSQAPSTSSPPLQESSPLSTQFILLSPLPQPSAPPSTQFIWFPNSATSSPEPTLKSPSPQTQPSSDVPLTNIPIPEIPSISVPTQTNSTSQTPSTASATNAPANIPQTQSTNIPEAPCTNAPQAPSNSSPGPLPQATRSPEPFTASPNPSPGLNHNNDPYHHGPRFPNHRRRGAGPGFFPGSNGFTFSPNRPQIISHGGHFNYTNLGRSLHVSGNGNHVTVE